MDNLRHQLVQQIEDAFADIKYPGDNHFTDDIFMEQLKGKLWQALQVDQGSRYSSDLPEFSPEGFAFYLPAFMKLTILHSEEADLLPDNLVSMLSYAVDKKQMRQETREFLSYTSIEVVQKSLKSYDSDEKRLGYGKNWLGKTVAYLSQPQRKVVHSFLVHFPELEPESYWLDSASAKACLDQAIEYWAEASRQP